MSNATPEARNFMSEKVLRGAEGTTTGLYELSSVLATDLPGLAEISEAATRSLTAERGEPTTHRRATEHLRRLSPERQTRARQLARTALVTSQATELIRHSHDRTAPPEARRLAVTLASSLLDRHFARRRRSRNINRGFSQD